MRASLLLCLFLCSCGGFVRVDPGGATTIQGGVLSSITGLAIKVTTKDGTKIAYSQTGYEGENVANNAILGLEAGKAVDGAVSTTRSNNGVKNVAAKEVTKQKGQALKAGTANKKIDANTSQFNTAVGAGATPTVGTVTPVGP